MISTNHYSFTGQNVNLAPNSAGVYGLYDQFGNVIYYGRATGDSVTIRSRLQDHASGREGSCTQAATSFNCEVTSYPITREKELLEEHKRFTGRLPRCNDRIG